jgi:hypothetical protein
MYHHRKRHYGGSDEAGDHIAYHDAPPFAGSLAEEEIALTCPAGVGISMVGT